LLIPTIDFGQKLLEATEPPTQQSVIALS